METRRIYPSMHTFRRGWKRFQISQFPWKLRPPTKRKLLNLFSALKLKRVRYSLAAYICLLLFNSVNGEHLILETRVIGVTVEDPVRVNPPSVAKCPASDLVYIRYLVRPYTQASLKTMLEKHFGTSVELWLDRIKSSAMARFVDQTTATK